MKKIYMIVYTLIFCGSLIGQNAYMVRKDNKDIRQGYLMQPSMSELSAASPNGGEFLDVVVDPILSILTKKGVIPPQIGFYPETVFQDSTVKVGDASGKTAVETIMLGSIFDPTSTSLNGGPICSAKDSFMLNNVYIRGRYARVTPASVKDTLYVWIVWGTAPTTTTPNPVFAKENTTLWYPSGYPPYIPIANWRTFILAPKLTGAIAAPGNKVKAAYPPNSRLIKRVLTELDSSVPLIAGNLDVGFDTMHIQIPKGNIVSCFYTFGPGGTYGPLDVTYTFNSSTAPQTINGFIGQTVSQSGTDYTASGGYQSYLVDGPGNGPNTATGWNMGLDYLDIQRHAGAWTYASKNNQIMGNLLQSPLIEYKISGFSTVGVDELYSNFTLGQNEPNPFTNQTVINYQLKTAAKNITLEIYNIAGVKMVEKTERNLGSGKYTFDINNVNFAEGIYFYSLNVDGNTTTKRMIKTK